MKRFLFLVLAVLLCAWTVPAQAADLTADPAANMIMVWDDTDNALRFAIIGSGLTYTAATDTLTSTGISDLDDLPGDTVDDNLIDQALIAGYGASATPGVTLADSNADATGTAFIAVDALTAGQDSILQVKVDDSSGEDTVYAEYDGVAEDIEFKLAVVAETSLTVATQFKLPSSDAGPTATAGYLRHDSTISNFTNGGLVYHNGVAIKQLVDMTTATASACTDDQIVAYDADADLWYCKADADTGGATAYDDIGDPDAATSISFGDNEGITYATVEDTGSVFLIDNSVADLSGDTYLIDLQFADSDDANGFYLRCLDDSDGSPNTVLTIGAKGSITSDGTISSDDITITGSDLTIGSAGVKLTGDGDGALTILGLGDGFDEDLTINLDDTENTAVVSSSTGVTGISFSALNLVTTGTILGAINVVVTTDGSESPTAAQMYGSMFIADHGTATSDTTYTLPAAAAGMTACFYDNGGGTGGVIVNPDDSDVVILNGTAKTAGEAIHSPGVAGDGANGDFICIMAIDATNWITLGRSGTWVEETP